MRTSGTVREWDGESGCGAIDSPETPGGVWVHFSHIAADGFRALTPGDDVDFEYEHVNNQDGYSFRAICVWRSGQERPQLPGPSSGPKAYRSSLTIEFF